VPLYFCDDSSLLDKDTLLKIMSITTINISTTNTKAVTQTVLRNYVYTNTTK